MSFCTQSRSRTGTSVTSLVFETNASTNSAIWAFQLFPSLAERDANMSKDFFPCKPIQGSAIIFFELKANGFPAKSGLVTAQTDLNSSESRY